jgi:error-prone DNA polymerase
MVKGFSGFGFPKAHGAAFGLLAYQSTWLRVHYGTEFLAALLDEQPMGFYPPDALVHEAQRRGIEVLAPEINASAVGCTVTGPATAPRVQIGLAYVLGVRADEIEALVAARDAEGPFRTLEDLASRSGAGRAALEQLAWSGACDALAGGDRRRALWELGVAAPGRRLRRPRSAADLTPRGAYASAAAATRAAQARRDIGVQLALPLGVGEAPPLRGLTGWEAMIADYSTTGLTTAAHPLGLLRGELRAQRMVANADLAQLPHGTAVRLGGLVVARQRPGTAKGVVFLLMEDETGTVNLIVPPKVYERDRTVVRAEPLVVVEGVLERHASAGGAINVVCRRLTRLDVSGQLQARPTEAGKNYAIVGGAERPAAQVKDFSMLDAIELARQDAARDAAAEEGELGATGTDDFRAVAPPVQSFASGRRR